MVCADEWMGAASRIPTNTAALPRPWNCWRFDFIGVSPESELREVLFSTGTFFPHICARLWPGIHTRVNDLDMARSLPLDSELS
jgi:hypothetical protein